MNESERFEIEQIRLRLHEINGNDPYLYAKYSEVTQRLWILSHKQINNPTCQFAIMNIQTIEYWVNDFGWVNDLNEADLFTRQEMIDFNLPTDGIWVFIA
jgi:hypothetical protein